MLDTGVDATHPDLAGRCRVAANFIPRDHVDGQRPRHPRRLDVAGTGAASDGKRKGVAPGATCWSARCSTTRQRPRTPRSSPAWSGPPQQGADVVSMSLGGEPTDGTDPMSQAVNELTAADRHAVRRSPPATPARREHVGSPGAADAALTVGAVDRDDTARRLLQPRPAPRRRRAQARDHRAGRRHRRRPRGRHRARRRRRRALHAPSTAPRWPPRTSPAPPRSSRSSHPDLDGSASRMRSPAVPCRSPSATAFEAGTGRVDALQALGANVVSAPALNLGSYPVAATGAAADAHAASLREPRRRPGDVGPLGRGAGQRGRAPAGVSLSASTLTLAPGGTAVVDVQLDPSIPGVGTFSGVVVADPGTGSSVRTAFGFSLESEHYDVTVDLTAACRHAAGVAPRRSRRPRQRILRATDVRGERIEVDDLPCPAWHVQCRRAHLRARRG